MEVILNKKMIFVTVTIFVIVLGLVGTRLGSSNSKKDKLIRISRFVATNPEFKEVENIDDINRISEIMSKVNWRKDIEEPLEENDYSFWIELEDDNRRFSDYDIWFNEQTIVWDPATNKYGYITDVNESNYLKEIISFY